MNNQTDAQSGGNLSTAGNTNLGGSSNFGTDDATSVKDMNDKLKAGQKGMRKKVLDPESQKLRE